MRKYLLFLMSLLAFGSVNAKSIDAATARRVAQTYLQWQGMRNTTSLVDVTSETSFTEFYIFAAPQGGFVLVSGDDCVVPILGYSAGNRFETKEMPESVVEWLKDYEKEIRYWRSREASGEWQAPDEVRQQWSLLAGGAMPQMSRSKSMNDTLTTNWSQGLYYNLFCPVDTNHSSGHAYTGCVATAMGMVMKYWNWPATGYSDHGYNHSNSDTSYGWQYADFGATSYQWDSMPTALTALTSGAQDSAVALLLYHSGVSVNMNYGINGSYAPTINNGSISNNSQDNALVKYFKYSPALHCVFRGDFSSSEWEAMMTAEIDAGRPVLYTGSGSGGHAFVLDGYNVDGYFHFNWGWGGSCNGYFPMGGLNPTSTRSYNRENYVNIGVEPNLSWGSGGTITGNVNDSLRGTATPSVTYNFGDTVTMHAYPNQGYRFTHWSDGSPYIKRDIYGTGGDYAFTAIFEPVGDDTIVMYGGGRVVTSYGWPSRGEYSWGVKYDTSYLRLGREIYGVELYVIEEGDYDVSVYLGNENDRYLMSNTTFTVDSLELNQWKTISLDTAVVVDGWESMWVIFHKVGTGYPASVTTYSGIDESFVSVNGDDFRIVGEQRQYSVMIRGLFRPTESLPIPHVYARCTEQIPVGGTATFTATGTPGVTVNWSFPGGNPATATGREVSSVYNVAGTYQAIASLTLGGVTATDTAMVIVIDYTEGDTLSYCLDRPVVSSAGTGDSTTWGVMFPAEYLHGRDYLNSVMLYVLNIGDYTLHVYQGGDTIPGREVYTQSFSVDSTELDVYRFCTPDSLVRIDTTQNLWIVFGSNARYPASFCNYMDEPNSNWMQEMDYWLQLNSVYPSTRWTWLIKAVTSKASEYSVTVNRVCRDCHEDIPADYVTGEGTYTEGATVTLEGLVQGCDISLDFWITETGDTIYANPYSFVIHSDRAITAVFGRYGGIDDVGAADVMIYVRDGYIFVDEFDGREVEVKVFDVMGRKYPTFVSRRSPYALPSGVYLVKVGERPARRVVVVR